MQRLTIIRYLFIAICIAITIYYALDTNYNALISGLAALILIIGAKRKNKIGMALQALRRDDHIRAEQFLSEINSIEDLNSNEKARWHFANGMIETQRQNWNEAISFYKDAIDLSLQNPKDELTALLNITIAFINLKNLEEALSFLNIAKEHPQASLLEKEMQWVESEIEKTNQ